MMKGNTAAFLRNSFIYLLDDLSDCIIDFLIGEDFLCGIGEEYVETLLNCKVMLLLSETFPDSSFEQIAFHWSLEQFLRY